MKTSKELGISPAPWTNVIETEKPFETNSVWDARNGGILTGGYTESLNDARLIAAAPDLYEALRECIGEMCKFCKDTEIGKSMPCERGCETMRRARAALEKAGGEA